MGKNCREIPRASVRETEMGYFFDGATDPFLNTKLEIISLMSRVTFPICIEETNSVKRHVPQIEDPFARFNSSLYFLHLPVHVSTPKRMCLNR